MVARDTPPVHKPRRRVRIRVLPGSKGDHDITVRLAEAGRILGIPLLDHVVVGADGY